MLSKAHAQVRREACVQRLNVAVGGGTGSGKSTIAGAIINEMVTCSDPSDRYVTIEEILEIQCRAKNLVQLHTAENADMRRLVRTTMRLRPTASLAAKCAVPRRFLTVLYLHRFRSTSTWPRISPPGKFTVWTLA